MKKIKKAAKSSASAPKPASKAKAKPTKTTAARATARTTKKTAPVKAKIRAKKPRVLAASKPTPAPTQTSAPLVIRASLVTTITAHIDIGFGNALYLRGEGADLSWDRGTLMHCVADNCWSLQLPESSRPVIFKFLVNDLSWSAGQDYSVPSGDTLATTPTF